MDVKESNCLNTDITIVSYQLQLETK